MKDYNWAKQYDRARQRREDRYVTDASSWEGKKNFSLAPSGETPYQEKRQKLSPEDAKYLDRITFGKQFSRVLYGLEDEEVFNDKMKKMYEREKNLHNDKQKSEFPSYEDWFQDIQESVEPYIGEEEIMDQKTKLHDTNRTDQQMIFGSKFVSDDKFQDLIRKIKRDDIDEETARIFQATPEELKLTYKLWKNKEPQKR